MVRGDLGHPIKRVLTIFLTVNHIWDHVNISCHYLLVEKGVLVVRHKLVAYINSLDWSTRAKLTASQKVGEDLSKVSIKGIDDGIEGGVGPTKPDEDIKGGLTDTGKTSVGITGWALTEGNHAVQDEEWQPAADKDTHDDRERLQHLGFFPDGGLEARVMVAVNVAAPAALCMLDCPLQGRDTTNLHLGNAVDSSVGNYHDSHRDIKTDQGG